MRAADFVVSLLLEHDDEHAEEPTRSLPLYPGARQCVNSGYCCRQAPCPFGTWDPVRKQCQHLTPDNKCAIHKEITDRPVDDWYTAPAFGAGCCSPLNPDRQAIFRKQKQKPPTQ